ncbi:MAG: hypothetical protein Q9160_002024 [Pyrenula sp. 1 TL-2023]
MLENDHVIPADRSSQEQESADPVNISERPAKRRRLAQKSPQSDCTSETEELELPSYPASAQVTDEEVDTEEQDGCPRKTKAQERQERIHVPKNVEAHENMFVTQLTQPKSSPSRIRGPRWKKQDPPQHGDDIASSFSHSAFDKTPAMKRAVAQPQRNGEGGAFAEQNSYPSRSDFPNEVPSDLEDAFDSSCLSDDEMRPPPRPEITNPKSLRQSTLFGTFSQKHEVSHGRSQTQGQKWPSAAKDEPPTHHKLDSDALRTWVYPTNIGLIRDYQFNIVHRGLFHNLLVSLPTGLGKTFIAAAIMLNWFRWTTEAQIVFVAPTKPLVAQQVDACFGIAGIPRSLTTMLTGNIQPALRAEEWQSKRVFFMTPQTLVHDLKSGICDPKKIVLLVVDEAHRATGNYAYVEIVRFLRRFNQSLRVLALTATPGSTVETVQNVIDGLDISRIEIRTEYSLDIRQFVHSRNIESEVFDNSDEMLMIMDLFSKALQPVLNRLVTQNAYWGRDPMQLTAYGLTKARQQWIASDAGRNANGATKGILNRIFTLLAGLAHSVELLKYYSIGSFYHKMITFSHDDSGKYAKEIKDHPDFKILMDRLRLWIRKDDFVGHPKLSYLKEVVLNHFLDAGEGIGAAGGRPPSNTRIMVFVHYRDCAEEVVRVLKQHEPMIRPHVFVGQAAAKGSDGMDQKTQLDIINKFKTGLYNTIVATSIGEEGLDIGEVDLIVCYDSSSSPIRMLQRMGRTGRKRSGNIVLLLMRGKEEDSYLKAKDNYEAIQRKIADGSEFRFHEDRSPRIVPKAVQPVVDKRQIEIPLENSQIDLPEPRKGRKARKKITRKFHMPDGVETGFVQASLLGPRKIDKSSRSDVNPASLIDETETADLPSLDNVLLSPTDMLNLEQSYCFTNGSDCEDIEGPRFSAFPHLQCTLRPTQSVGHSQVTRRFVTAMKESKGNTFTTFGRKDQMSRKKARRNRGQIIVSPSSRDPESTTRSSGNVASRESRPGGINQKATANEDRIKKVSWLSQESRASPESEDLPDLDGLFNGNRNAPGNDERSIEIERPRPKHRARRLVLDEDDDND